MAYTVEPVSLAKPDPHVSAYLVSCVGECGQVATPLLCLVISIEWRLLLFIFITCLNFKVRENYINVTIFKNVLFTGSTVVFFHCTY